MPEAQHVWALILAGGEGTRLRALTTQPCGTAVPKQFCSLRGGHSLLEDAIDRAGRLLPRERICAIVAEQHRRWWAEGQLAGLPAGNLIVQPRNRGTGIGILFSLMHLLARDPEALLVLLPADHYVREEDILCHSLRQALAQLEQDASQVVLLGVAPEEPDPELGYIMPADGSAAVLRGVARFVEKPAPELAAGMVRAGGLWNTFIIVGAARRLLNLFLPRYAELVMRMQVTVSRALSAAAPAAGWPALLELYEVLPDLDFSRDLLAGQESQLSVLRVPPCGWSDLGTPRRVGQALRLLSAQRELAVGTTRQIHAQVNLAAQHAHFERSQTTLRL